MHSDCQTIRTSTISAASAPFISAYYYLWYFTPSGTREDRQGTGKWAEKYARALLDPPQFPTLGEYVSNDPLVVERHIDWAADHGIDCFIANWEGMQGHAKFLSENLVHILQGQPGSDCWSPGKMPFSSHDSTGNGWDARSMGWDQNGFAVRNLNRMKFSVLFESRLVFKHWPPDAADPATRQVLRESIIYFAENFFGSPQWHRIDGRPVVYTYEIFSMLGTAADFLSMRTELEAAVQEITDPLTGQPYKGLYLVGDSLYGFANEDLERMKMWDAISGYQPYRSAPSAVAVASDELNGWRGREFFECEYFQGQYRRFSKWAQESGRHIIPTVLPRYNDRGVRGEVDHYTIPQCSRPPYDDLTDIRENRFFKGMIESLMPYVDRQRPMINITSWNEWFEDTSIEPIGHFAEQGLPDYCKQGENYHAVATQGWKRDVPDRIPVYGFNGHEWIDTPAEIKQRGIDVTEGFPWMCYGFDYLTTLSNYFRRIEISCPSKAQLGEPLVLWISVSNPKQVGAPFSGRVRVHAAGQMYECGLPTGTAILKIPTAGLAAGPLDLSIETPDTYPCEQRHVVQVELVNRQTIGPVFSGPGLTPAAVTQAHAQ